VIGYGPAAYNLLNLNSDIGVRRDTVDFVVATAQEAGDDSTSLSAQITSAQSIDNCLLSIAAVGLLALRWRRRAS